MFHSHKQFAGASTGNEWPLSVATQAPWWCNTISAEQRLVAPSREDNVANCFEIQWSPIFWHTASNYQRSSIPCFWEWRIMSQLHVSLIKCCRATAKNTLFPRRWCQGRSTVFSRLTYKCNAHTHTHPHSFHHFLWKQWEERKVNKLKGIQSD